MNDTTSDAANIFAPLWKRKWLILAVGILAGVGTYFYYKHQPASYSASTQLYLGSGAEQQSALNGNPGKSLSGRALTDQVGLINSPVIGESVRKRLRQEGNIAAARGKAKATASATSDFITITTTARTPRAAINLANGYAQAYIKRQRANYLRSVQAQITNTREQLHRLEAAQSGLAKTKGKGANPTSSATTIQAANLNSKLSQLESALAVTGVQQVSPAKAAPIPVSASPKKNAIFGFVLGIALASIAAYVLSRFDHRMRSLAEIEAAFGAQILAALPSVRSPVIRPDGERAPAKSLLEPLRRLHTTLQLGEMFDHDHAGEHGTRSILFLSADAGDGKSALIANLACVQRDAGERVVVVDADFRRPVQARLLDVEAPGGLADVLTGAITSAEAMRMAPRPPAASANPDGAAAGVSTVVQSSGVGALSVLPSGEAAANPPALLAGRTMANLLRSLREEYDHVLIDAPPPLEVSDAMPLLPLVDGIVIVARIGHTRDLSARRLVELLGRVSSAPVLGVVVNCARRSDIEHYGFAVASGTQRRGRKLVGR
jgi:succinoglycan biosynthesis transport protein ExoP